MVAATQKTDKTVFAGHRFIEPRLSVTGYEFTLDQGLKLSEVANLQDNIALALGASSVRIALPPVRSPSWALRCPTAMSRRCVSGMLSREAPPPNYPSSAAFAEGKAIGGNCVVSNIAKLPPCAPAL